MVRVKFNNNHLVVIKNIGDNHLVVSKISLVDKFTIDLQRNIKVL